MVWDLHARRAVRAPAFGTGNIELERQIADNYAEKVLGKMEQSRGELDQVYLSYEVAAHLQIISTMEVARRHASPELAQILASSIETMKEHGREAEQLMHELDPDTRRSQQAR